MSDPTNRKRMREPAFIRQVKRIRKAKPTGSDADADPAVSLSVELLLAALEGNPRRGISDAESRARHARFSALERAGVPRPQTNAIMEVEFSVGSSGRHRLAVHHREHEARLKNWPPTDD